jgi:glutathione synthase/RimK-type ligase-like ATP-grasp enzyme
MLLILSDEDSAHHQPIVEKLDAVNIPVTIIPLDVFPGPTVGVSLTPDNGISLFRTPDTTIASSDVYLVWDTYIPTFKRTQVPEELKPYVYRETNAFLQALPYYFPSSTAWINSPEKAITANLKPVQLKIAHSLGFQIPASCFSNDPEVIAAFAQTIDSVAVKAVESGFYLTAKNGEDWVNMNYTQAMTPSQLSDRLNQAAYCPTIYQEYISKAYECRVTVIGTQVFAFRIDSCLEGQIAVDWRHPDNKTQYTLIELDEALKTGCLLLLNTLGLDMGAIDLVIKPDGTPVFLEINPKFAWLWLQNLTGATIDDAIVAHLKNRYQTVLASRK